MTAQLLLTEVVDTLDAMLAIRALATGGPVISKSSPVDPTDTGITLGGGNVGSGILYARPQAGAGLNLYRLTCSVAGGVATRSANATHTATFNAAARTIQSDSDSDWTTIITGLAVGDFLQLGGTASNDKDNHLHRVLTIANNNATNDLITLETTESLVDEVGISTTFVRWSGGAVFNVRQDPAGANTDLGNMTVGRQAFFNDNNLTMQIRNIVNWAVSDTLEFTLVANALVAASQDWTDNKTEIGLPDSDLIYTVEMYLEGPGLSTTESINVNFLSTSNFGTDIYNWRMRGADGFVTSSIFSEQPNVSPEVFISGTDSPMFLWLTVSGDRIMGAMRAQAGVFEHFYGGFGDVLANTNQHPRPLLIGGSHISNTQPTDSQPEHSAYWDPIQTSPPIAQSTDAFDRSSLLMRWVDGQWFNVGNGVEANRSGQSPLWVYPRGFDNSEVSGSETTTLKSEQVFYSGIRPSPGDRYQLIPHTIAMREPDQNIVMDLQGVFFVTGFSIASEDTITIGSDEYIILNNVNATGQGDFAALRLTGP